MKIVDDFKEMGQGFVDLVKDWPNSALKFRYGVGVGIFTWVTTLILLAPFVMIGVLILTHP